MLPTELAAEFTVELTDEQPATARPTASNTPRPAHRPDNPGLTRDAETETLLRTCTYPSFRAAGLDLTLVRSTHLRDAALNSFMNTGNRMFMDSALVPGRRHGGKTAIGENRKGF